MERKALNWMKLGLICCCVHVKLGGLELLPEFVGFGMLLAAIRCHSHRTETERRMEPFLLVLLIYSLVGWLLSLSGGGMQGQGLAIGQGMAAGQNIAAGQGMTAGQGVCVWLSGIHGNGVVRLLVNVINLYAFYVLAGEVRKRIQEAQPQTARQLGCLRVWAVVLLTVGFLMTPYNITWLGTLLVLMTLGLLAVTLVVLWQIQPVPEES